MSFESVERAEYMRFVTKNRSDVVIIAGVPCCIDDLNNRLVQMEKQKLIQLDKCSLVSDLLSLSIQIESMKECIAIVSDRMSETENHKFKELSVINKKDCEFCGCEKAIVIKGFSKLGKCSLCKQTTYCSQDCQSNHWNSGHRRECMRELMLSGIRIITEPEHVMLLFNALGGKKNLDAIGSNAFESLTEGIIAYSYVTPYALKRA